MANVEKSMTKLKRTASGPDGLPYWLWRDIINELRQPISDEFDALRQQPDFIRRAVREPYFVSRKMTDILKDKALDILTVVYAC